uniref:FCP1 homology domain-containing protein n=1 Tax=Strombidium rassoulzadegani TaxID=1082188 RepID=A0A7S3FTU1_9SPIT|mmetsp:Transcript_14149/g.24038  ORF Transcript_14149/g.24038 Transcript_14149/m.24038 type:complete len:253 (+) Transcript_14149:1057-1815(+)
MVTKVPQYQNEGEGDENEEEEQDLHKQHFIQTVQALQIIKQWQAYPNHDKRLEVPSAQINNSGKKLLIFDMDETLIHCVDDIEQQNPEVILEIDFSDDEETVYAGINLRPYIIECLEEAKKNFHVIVFTASQQTYADAILDYIDPNNTLFEARFYRQHCFLTEEGYYVKDLRIFADWRLCDIVIVDNSVFSFAFQIDNGIPIIPFYNDKSDEEMLHLVYYLNQLATVEDVREQNRQAFELFKLGQSNQEEGV